ncbi:MAG: hypothetical protein ACJ8CR_30555 [Roseiflexaceae bacterium]
MALLLSLLMLVTLLPSAVLAQPRTPPAGGKPPIYEARPLSEGDLTAPTAEPASPAEERAVAPQPATVEPLQPASPAADAQGAITPSTQGVVQVDVSVPATIRAGQNITFTYIYTNTGLTSVSGISIKALWPYNVGDSNSVIYCGGDNCAPNAIAGPPVIRDALQPNPTFAIYRLSSPLSGNTGGRFSVYMRSNAGYYPKTGQSITRPSGSAELYTPASATRMSDDTASSLIIGPVFYMTKTVANSVPIYPVIETAVFTLTVGNATGPGDVVNNNRRADAQDATNVVLTDFFPLDGIFVSATPSVGTVTPSIGKLTWSFPSLPKGQTRQVVLRFKKGDTNQQCDVLSNYNYNVTSTEMPSGQLPVNGQQNAQVGVITPLKVASIIFVPSSTIFGNQLSANIIIENYWNQDLNGVVFNYDIQSNADYINNGSAVPPTTSVNGKRLSWTFNMAKAANKTTPTSKTFSFNLLAGYSSQANPSANAQIVPPAGVPSQCVRSLSHAASLRERLSFTKTTDADPATQIGGNLYAVKRGQQFNYIITVRNEGSGPANPVKVVDLIPSGSGANFSYVAGSGTLNGSPRAPNLIQNGNNGRLEWDNLTVPAGQTIRLRYTLIVQGDDYFTYCNVANVTGPQSETVINGGNSICVKINPNIDISKVIVTKPSNPQPGDTIRFRLTLTNHETIPYTLGLYDFFYDYVNVRQVTGYATPVSDGASRLKWPKVSIPAGAQNQIWAEIDADIPNVCQTRTYPNEGLFWYTGSQGDVIIHRIPEMIASVLVICGKINYTKGVYTALAPGGTVSLGDRVGYQISSFNADSMAYNNVQVDDYLPPGFKFDSMDTSSAISAAPTQQTVTVVNPQTQQNETRTKLHWTIPLIASGSTVNIKYIARAGAVVGLAANWAQVLDVGLCTSDCIVANGGNVLSRFNVLVQPLITSEPSVSPNTCAQPNQIRTYKVSIVNTNNHAYASTGVTVTLPLGLRFGGVVGDTPQPSVVTTDAVGVTMVSWSGLSIAAGAPFSQKDLQMNLLIGQVWGELHTSVQTTSPDGLIPLKDGATDVTVTVCPLSQTQGSLAKDVSRTTIKADDDLVYQISLANPTASSISTTITDQLPANMTYLDMVEGSGPSSTSPLTWNVTVPAAAGGKPGILVLKFRVHVNSVDLDAVYPNTVVSSTPMNTTYATVIVAGRRNTYLPIIAR